MLSADQIHAFDSQGYLHLKGMFSPAEIEALRAVAATVPPAEMTVRYLYELPGLDTWWNDRRLIEIARDLVGAPLVYSFEGHLLRYNFRPGQHVAGRHLHHDAKGTVQNIFNRVNEALPTTYPALRFAIYLQDTASQSGGLKIAPGSHKMDVSSFEGRSIPLQNVGTQPGDLVVFTHRILHSPFALRLKDDPSRALSPYEEDVLFAKQPHLFLPMPGVRETVFVDFMSGTELTDLYIKNRAVSSTDTSGHLAEWLVDKGFLDQNDGGSILFRVDRAIVETIDNTVRNLSNGSLTPGAVAHLRRLPRLCRAHFEFSSHHFLHDSEVPDDTLETAVRLFNEIAPRVVQLKAQSAQRRPDDHMAATNLAALGQGEAAAEGNSSLIITPGHEPPGYNPRMWGDFNRERKLSCPTRKIVRPDTRIFAMGSCFAMQIRRAMSARGLAVYPNYAGVPYDRAHEIFDKIPEREALQHYDTFSMRQEFEAALGGWPDRAEGYWPVQDAPVNQFLKAEQVYQDPYRKLVYASSLPRLIDLSQRITNSIRDGLDACDVVVLTLGLTEVWRHNLTGRYLCRPPGTGYGGGAGLATFRQSTFLENYQNMRAILDLLFARYPRKQVVISVSPIALDATYSQYDVGTANNESKAILRAVAGQICREYDNIMYFPSYEMATILRREVFDEDGRHVLQSFADQVVAAFVAATST